MMSTLGGGDFELAVRQQPKYACVAIGKERKPIDPPPIVQLIVNPRKDPARTFLQNPYLILTARLIRKGDEGEQDEQSGPKESDLTGTLVSSLYSLKDTDNSQGGFFVFGDLSVRRVGTYRLAFILYELKLAEKECWLLSRTVSDPFVVYATKTFPGLAESTFLTRSFSDQGVRLRLRKDSRTVSTKKRTIGQAEQIRASQGMHGYLPHDAGHDLSPNGHSPHHHLRRLNTLQDPSLPPGQLDRSRGSIGSQGSYYTDSPQLRSGEYTPSSYGYGFKRPRMDDDSPHAGAGYESDSLSSIYPLPTTSFPVPTQPALTGLPMPSPYASMPRLDTTHLPPHSPATAGAPGSATSTFSPGTRRSPGGYSYPPQPQAGGGGPPTPGMFTSTAGPVTTVPASLPYHHPGPHHAGLPPPHHHHHHQAAGLGITLSAGGLELDGEGRQ